MSIAAWLVLVLLAVDVVPATADAPAPKQVLLVFSHERERWVYDALESNLRAEIESAVPSGLTVFTEYLDTMRFADAQFREQTVEYFDAKYAQRQLGAIVPVSPLALDFVLDHRERLFPGVPIVFASVNRSRVEELSTLPNLTGVAVIRELTWTLDLALQLQPETKTVFIPAGTSDIERGWTDDTRRLLRHYEDRLQIEFLTDLHMSDLENRLSHLPAHSVVLSAGLMFHDASGQYFLPEEILRQICRVSNAPVYATNEAELGLGIVGGSLYDMAPVGSATGVMVRRVLAGEPVSSIPIQAFKSDLNLFDARELRRWRIDERRLPANAIVRFRAPSLWRDYRNEVLGVSVALALQSLLIVGLLYQRRARRRAEIDSRRSLALAADANRRVTMSAMTASLAHELNQPLSSILHNAQAGEKLLTSSRATPETLREILSDIVSEDARAAQIVDRHRAMLRHHQIDMKPIDIHAVVRESVAVVSHELTGRRIQADADSPAEACVVAGDHVLLQQVFVNLLMNAMDAMADARPDRRRIAVRSTATRDGVEVSVRDRGTGLPAAIDGRVFEPFVTTKPHGLGIGLTIARTIVEAHGGTMDARNNADGGATFTVTLPRAHTS